HGPPTNLISSSAPIPIPGPNEFRVKVSACAICGHDVLARAGKLSTSLEQKILGHEIAGVIDSVGSENLNDWLGLRVALNQRRSCGQCSSCLSNATNQCRQGVGFYGEDTPGGYAEY